MNFTKIAFAAAAVLLASQANAGYIVEPIVSPIPAGNYVAPTFLAGSTGTTVQSGSLTNVYLQPQGTNDSYMVVTTGGTATVDAFGASSYSFVWGSPDAFNTVTVTGSDFTKTFTGSDFFAPANGNNAETFLFSIAGTEGSTIDSLTFSSDGVAFEVAVAAVPEPETYALMLAGLGIVGFMARRRKA